MERKINTRIEQFYIAYKEMIKSGVVETISSIHDKVDTIYDGDHSEELKQIIQKELMTCLQQLYDHPILHLEKIDFQKRKRVKNIVPLYERCNACRATGEQCTRRKKAGLQFCGTHYKGTPHGVISSDVSTNNVSNIKKVNVWAQDIKGIIYYIDDDHNVYDTTAIMVGHENPSIIAKYIKNLDNKGDTIYEIPEFTH